MESQNLVESTGNQGHQGHVEDLESKKSAHTDLLGTEAQGVLVRR